MTLAVRSADRGGPERHAAPRPRRPAETGHAVGTVRRFGPKRSSGFAYRPTVVATWLQAAMSGAGEMRCEVEYTDEFEAWWNELPNIGSNASFDDEKRRRGDQVPAGGGDAGHPPANRRRRSAVLLQYGGGRGNRSTGCR